MGVTCKNNSNYDDMLLEQMKLEVDKAKGYAEAAGLLSSELNVSSGHVLNDIAAIYNIPADQMHTYPLDGSDVIEGHYYLYMNNNSAEIWQAKGTESGTEPNSDNFSLMPALNRGGLMVTKELGGTWDLDIDVSAGSVQKFTMVRPKTTIVFENVPNTQGNTVEVTLVLKQGLGSGEVVWPENIHWQNGRPPVLSYQKDSVNIIQFVFVDGEPNPYGFFSAGWM